MHSSKKAWFCILLVVCALFVASGCKSLSNQPPVKEDLSLSEGISQLLESVLDSDTFVFEEMPWLMSKEEVIQQKQVVDIQINEINRLVVGGKLPLEPAMKQHIIYNFENDQLVSGEYWFITTEQALFDELGLAVKGVVQESFPEPRSTNLDTLDTATASAEKHEMIMWQGTDRSYMRVSMLTNEASEFTLQIQVSSPLGERNSLQ